MNAQSAAVSDATWKDIGVPYTPNDDDTFVNGTSGGGSMFGGNAGTGNILPSTIPMPTEKSSLNSKGCTWAVRCTSTVLFFPVTARVTADANATHVIGFMGFVVDVTPYVTFGGADNLAGRAGRQSGGFYEDPGFSEVFRFGSEDGGIFRPVCMHITDNVHVPVNLYSTLNQWGTYVATTAATDASATVRMLTNVRNDGAAAQSRYGHHQNGGRRQQCACRA